MSLLLPINDGVAVVVGRGASGETSVEQPIFYAIKSCIIKLLDNIFQTIKKWCTTYSRRTRSYTACRVILAGMFYFLLLLLE